jgi:hypothetical protein
MPTFFGERMISKIKLINNKLEKSFVKLKTDDPEMYKFVLRAFNDIEDNAFCGIQIPKRLIPSDYLKKFEVRNVWKYNLPGAWRLLYSIENTGIAVISIILEWIDHKTYERRFKY